MPDKDSVLVVSSPKTTESRKPDGPKDALVVDAAAKSAAIAPPPDPVVVLEPDGVENLFSEPEEKPKVFSKEWIGIHKRTRDQREKDLQYIRVAFHRRKSETEIADELSAIRPYKLCRQQINYDKKEIERRAAERISKYANIAKDCMLDEISMVEAELWAGFEKSKKPAKLAREIRDIHSDGKDSGSKRIVQQVEERDGDVAWLREIRELYKLRAEILGTMAPIKLEATVEHGLQITELRNAFEKRYGVRLKPIVDTGRLALPAPKAP